MVDNGDWEAGGTLSGVWDGSGLDWYGPMYGPSLEFAVAAIARCEACHEWFVKGDGVSAVISEEFHESISIVFRHDRCWGDDDPDDEPSA